MMGSGRACLVRCGYYNISAPLLSVCLFFKSLGGGDVSVGIPLPNAVGPAGLFCLGNGRHGPFHLTKGGGKLYNRTAFKRQEETL